MAAPTGVKKFKIEGTKNLFTDSEGKNAFEEMRNALLKRQFENKTQMLKTTRLSILGILKKFKTEKRLWLKDGTRV